MFTKFWIELLSTETYKLVLMSVLVIAWILATIQILRFYKILKRYFKGW